MRRLTCAFLCAPACKPACYRWGGGGDIVPRRGGNAKARVGKARQQRPGPIPVSAWRLGATSARSLGMSLPFRGDLTIIQAPRSPVVPNERAEFYF